jgi:hypothetical protein
LPENDCVVIIYQKNIICITGSLIVYSIYFCRGGGGVVVAAAVVVVVVVKIAKGSTAEPNNT